MVVVDCDSDGALEVVAKMREIADSDSIDVLFIGRLGAAFQVAEEALVHEGSGFFERPVDADAVVRKVAALLQIDVPPRASSPPAAPEEALDAGWKPSDAPPPKSAQLKSSPPKSSPPKSTPPKSASSPPKSAPPNASVAPPASQNPAPESTSRPLNSLPAPGIREAPSSPPPSLPRISKSPSQPPISAPSATRARRGAQGPLSEELMQLLAEAEERLGEEAVMYDSPSISPEDEINAVLPEDILAALDEPLEEQEDDDVNDSALGSPGHVTTSGGSKHTTGASRRHTTNIPVDPSTGSIANPSSEQQSSGPSTSTNLNAPFGVRVSSSVALSAMAPIVSPGAYQAMSSPTIAPHHSSNTTSHGTTALGLTGAAATTQSESPGRPFRAGSDLPPIFASPQSHEPATSPRGSDSSRGSSRPPPTAMTPSAAGFTLGSDLLMPVALALESLQQLPPPMDMRRDPPPPLIIADARQPPDVPAVLGPADAPRAIARSIATRTTGTLCLESKEGVRRIVLREGDLVTAASGVDDESLIAFLVAHGDLPRESLTQLAGRFATFGRHAGAALVAQGYLRQDQLWPVLRAHAEWILGKALAIDVGTAMVEPDAPGRLRGEPSVFGGSTGAEVFVEVVRRVVAQEDAFARLGGGPARIGEGRNEGLLTECALGAPEVAVLEQLRGTSIAQALASSPDTDMIAVLYALHLLGVIEVVRSLGGPPTRDQASPSSSHSTDTIDDDAIRARVRARLDLVEEGDYFAVLGVARSATSYEVRRAFTELRRTFDPDRILTPANADLAPSVRKIVNVLEEAYDILHDAARRERYRRAIDAVF